MGFKKRLADGLKAEEKVYDYLIENGVEATRLILGENQSTPQQNAEEGDLVFGPDKIHVDVKKGWLLSEKSILRFKGEYFILGGDNPETSYLVQASSIKGYYKMVKKDNNLIRLESGDGGIKINKNTFNNKISLKKYISNLKKE